MRSIAFLISLLFSNQAMGASYFWHPAPPPAPKRTTVRRQTVKQNQVAQAAVRTVITRPIPVRSEPLFTPMFKGVVEARPAYNAATEKSFGQVFAEVGFQFTPTLFVGYQQRMQHSLRESLANNEDFMLDDGFIHVMADKIWKSTSYPLSLSYEGRLIMPTNEIARDAGFQFAIRNYFTFRRQITPNFAMLFTEIPIVYAYSKPGSGTGKTAAANPAFENRIYFGPEFSWDNGTILWNNMLSFGMTKYRAFNSNALHDDVWVGSLWIYSEIDFKLSDFITIGIAYESGRFVDFELTDAASQENSGTFKGVGEAILRLSF